MTFPTPITAKEFTSSTESQTLSMRGALGVTKVIRNAREFGILPSAGIPNSNNTAALINAAYIRAVDEGFSIAFDFEPGKYYWLESSLLCFRLNSGGTAFLKRDMPALIGNTGFNASAGEQAIQFIATHTNPVIITQGGNSFCVSKLWIRRLLQHSNSTTAAAYAAAVLTGPTQTFTNHALWNDGDQRHTQWSPTCGIAIDPFGSLVPSGQRYPGLEAYYAVTPTYSSQVLIDNCAFWMTRVGVLNGVGVDANSDGITIRDCVFTKLKYCYVSCHSQTQNVLIERPTISEVWAVQGNSVHGGLNGRWAGISNPGNCSYIANIYGGDGVIDGVIHPDWQVSFDGANSNWENLGSIIDTSAAQGLRAGVSISNATFAFDYTGRPHIITGRRTVFKNCEFILNGGAGEKIWIESRQTDSLPATWDSTGFVGSVRGAETVFDNCGFSAAGAELANVSDLLSFGSMTTAHKNWIRFYNCTARIGGLGTLYQHMINCRGGAI